MNSSAPPAVSPEAAAAIERCRPALRRYVRFLTGGDEAGADGIIASAAEELARIPADELADDAVERLYAAARRRAVGNLTRTAAEDTGPAGHDALPADDGDEPEHTTVLRLLDRLTLKQQEVVRLKFQHDFEFVAIGRIAGLTPAAAGSLLHQAVTRIGRVLARRQAEPAVGSGMDDPRLTAFALGALPPAEQAGFGRQLAMQPGAKAQVRQIKAWSDAVDRALAVEAGTARAPRRRRKRPGAGRASRWLSVGLLVAAAAGGFWWRSAQKDVEPAQRTRLPATGLEGDVQVGRAETEAGPARGAPGLRAEGGTIPPSGVARRASVEKSRPIVATIPSVNPTASPARVDPEAVRPEPAAELRGRIGAVAAQPEADWRGDAGPAAVAEAPASGAPVSEAPAVDAGLDSRPQGSSSAADAPVRPVPAAPAVSDPGGEPARHAVNREASRPAKAGAEAPFAVALELVRSPEHADRVFTRLRLVARDPAALTRPAANLVFVVDVSRSMEGPNRLPLVREAVGRLLDRLQPEDRITLVTYAEGASVALPAVPVAEGGRIRAALAALQPTGLTNGSAGLQLGYTLAAQRRTEVGVNAVVLCTDGNFNLGLVAPEELAALAQANRERGLRLHVFGFGRSDRNDPRLERLAVEGGGRSGYVNTLAEAGRLLVEQVDGLLEPLAGDFEVQARFNPAAVARVEAAGGEPGVWGPGRPVALWRAAQLRPGDAVEWLHEVAPAAGRGPEAAWLEVAVRYRDTRTGEPRARTVALGGEPIELAEATPEVRCAVAVAELRRVMRLPASPERRAALERVAGWGEAALTEEEGGYRREFLGLVEQARFLDSAGK